MKVESTIERLKRIAREAKLKSQGTAATLPTALTALNEQVKQALAPTPDNVPESFNGVPYTDEQLTAIQYALQSQSFCMTGAAGTGKTTTTRGVVSALIQSNKIPLLSITHRYLESGVPGIVGCAFTNKAVQNIKRVMPADLQRNFMTVHKLLEFEPVYYEEWNAEKGKLVNKMEFRPARNKLNPLPESLRVLIIEEATMVSIELWNQLFDALPTGGNCQIILIGDIQQLPPVFGKSIFIHAMQVGIKVVELTKVHRQALDSPILELAHRILSGKIIPSVELPEWNKQTESGKLTIVPWKKELSSEMSVIKVAKQFLPAAMEKGDYDPYNDCILTPFNVNFGTQEINKHIATYMAQSDKWNPGKELVHEVIGGVNTKYFRIGDKVLWAKTEHVITDIKINGKYYEKDPQLPSRTLDYWGNETDEHAQDLMMAMLEGGESADAHSDKIDMLLKSFQEMGGDSEEKGGRQASHIITVESPDFGETKIETSGDLANLDLAYAITVHKSQGSEYRRVYFVTHKSQATMLFRELLYTAITRAKEELVVICPPSLFVQGITSQRLPGKTLEEKIAAFSRYLETSKTSSTELPKGISLLVKEAA